VIRLTGPMALLAAVAMVLRRGFAKNPNVYPCDMEALKGKKIDPDTFVLELDTNMVSTRMLPHEGSL
jgi:hypothetical protein